jgi:hypothetical protein
MLPAWSFAAATKGDHLTSLQIILTVGIGLFMAATTLLALRRRSERSSDSQSGALPEPTETNLPYEDPGWLPALARMYIGSQFAFKKRPSDGMIILRLLFLSLLISAFLILFVLSFIIDRFGAIELALAVGIATFGAMGVAAAFWARNRELDLSGPAMLAHSYRTNFFLGFALSQAPLLISFVISLIKHEQWPYLVALPFHLIGMAVIAPSRRNLTRYQAQIVRRGSTISLAEALSTFPPNRGQK